MSALSGQPAEGSGTVVVGVDDSEGSVRALRWAADYALRNKTALLVVSVWRWSPAPAVVLGSVEPGWSDGGEVRARSDLGHVVERALGGDAGVQTHLVESGHVGEALVAAAEGAALLVVGRHRQKPIVNSMLGSTSRYVTLHASCPVVVVPAPPEGRRLLDPIALFSGRRETAGTGHAEEVREHAAAPAELADRVAPAGSSG